MKPQEYYRLAGPSERSGPPEWYSPTALAALERCPLQWQLEHSRWGDMPRHPGIPNRRRVEGSIVHDLLEAMFRQLGRAGRPDLGTDGFRTAMRELKVQEVLGRLLAREDERWAEHPRTKGAPLSLDPGELRNRTFAMFRKTYQPATTAGPSSGSRTSDALGSEVSIEDAELRLRGRIDLAKPAELTEFKTGNARPEHEHQIELYGLMWSRQRGVNPTLTLVYPDESKTWKPTSSQIAAVQRELESKISEYDRLLDGEAPARPGEHCVHCAVRAFCSTYWEEPRASDMEFVLAQVPGVHAIGAGKVLIGLHAAHVACVGDIAVGDKVRLLGVKVKGTEVELPPWGEVFLVP